jgi:hypothetical protein
MGGWVFEFPAGCNIASDLLQQRVVVYSQAHAGDATPHGTLLGPASLVAAGGSHAGRGEASEQPGG